MQEEVELFRRGGGAARVQGGRSRHGAHPEDGVSHSYLPSNHCVRRTTDFPRISKICAAAAAAAGVTACRSYLVRPLGFCRICRPSKSLDPLASAFDLAVLIRLPITATFPAEVSSPAPTVWTRKGAGRPRRLSLQTRIVYKSRCGTKLGVAGCTAATLRFGYPARFA